MRTILISGLTAVVAAVVAVVIALAVDGGETPAVQEAPVQTAAASAALAPAAPAAPAEPGAKSLAAAGGEVAAPVQEPEGDVGAVVLAPAFDPVQIFRDVSPAVASIEVNGGGGSGFVVDADGHIVTNYHVVRGNATVMVGLADGRRVPGAVLGFDPHNDLAVVKIDPAGLDLQPVRLGDSAALVVGEPVAAIGNPFGLERTLTTGVISGLERVRPALERGGRPQRGLVQTDVSINPGNSGGPLINADGAVIGVNASAESPVSGSVGIGFAVPSNIVIRFLPDMIAGREIQHPWMGIAGGAATEDEPGLPLVEVIAGSPADLAGMLVGDRILRVDGETLASFDELARLLDAQEVGATLTFDVLRSGTIVRLPVTLAAWPG